MLPRALIQLEAVSLSSFAPALSGLEEKEEEEEEEGEKTRRKLALVYVGVRDEP